MSESSHPIHRLTYIHCIWLSLILSLSYCMNGIAQEPKHWRYWRTEDGLWDAVTAQAEVGKDGKIWITHGSIDNMSILNGYSIKYIPRPGSYLPVFVTSPGQVS